MGGWLDRGECRNENIYLYFVCFIVTRKILGFYTSVVNSRIDKTSETSYKRGVVETPSTIIPEASPDITSSYYFSIIFFSSKSLSSFLFFSFYFLSKTV